MTQRRFLEKPHVQLLDDDIIGLPVLITRSLQIVAILVRWQSDYLRSIPVYRERARTPALYKAMKLTAGGWARTTHARDNSARTRPRAQTMPYPCKTSFDGR
jgi:hypothetical protein